MEPRQQPLTLDFLGFPLAAMVRGTLIRDGCEEGHSATTRPLPEAAESLRPKQPVRGCLPAPAPVFLFTSGRVYVRACDLGEPICLCLGGVGWSAF